MADGFFRCKQGYTVVQNVISRDKSISMRAKGLYLIIQSYITMPDKRWLKSEFMKMVPEGEKSFNGAWTELKLKGYLKCQIHVDGNKFVREYELLDEPDYGPHTFHYNAKGELTKTEGGEENNVENSESLENTEDLLLCQKGHVVKGSVVKGHVVEGQGVTGHVVNGGANNKSFNNNTLENININNINPSFIHARTEEPAVDNSSSGVYENEGMNEAPTEVTLDLNKYLLPGDSEVILGEVKKNCGIPYDYAFEVKDMTIAIQAFSNWNDYESVVGEGDLEAEAYKTTVECLIEMATSQTLMELKGARISYKNVIDRLNSIDGVPEGYTGALTCFIDCVVRRYKEATEGKRIRNFKGYLKSMIWESFSIYKMDFQSYFSHSYAEGRKREIEEQEEKKKREFEEKYGLYF